MKGIYFVNYFQNLFRNNTRKYFAQASRYRLMFSCLALICFDHSLDYKVEKDLKKVIGVKKAFDKIDTDDQIKGLIKAVGEKDNNELI
mmetsp:Transcript_32407/g.28697  ORF Transcript_32407/g.28697 Transcript_32407/m.28697 type:complete len:88 (+) Transcript_32407:21-284(+)